MRWLLITLLAVAATAIADAYVAIPWDTSKALYFPNVETVQCYAAVADSEPAAIHTDRCWPVFLPSVFVQGNLLLMNRPLEQLMKSCESLNCVLRDMPDE